MAIPARRFAPQQFAAGLLAFALAAGQAAAAEPDGAAWLVRMGAALREQNYRGLFTYIRGPEMDTMRIVHRVADGKEFERLVHMNGEPREIYTDDGGTRCLHLPGQISEIHGLPVGPFTRTFNDNLAVNSNVYQVALGERGRVASRAARQVLIQPETPDRYGYELWLDEETGLLLQSQLVHEGQVLEAFQFAEVEIGLPIPERALASTLPAAAIIHPLSGELLEAAQAVPAQPEASFAPDWLPLGFMRVPLGSRDNQLSYSDGLATFSIFVDNTAADDSAELATKVGGTVMVSHRLAGTGDLVTLVGELPLVTARRVASSVRKVVR